MYVGQEANTWIEDMARLPVQNSFYIFHFSKLYPLYNY